MKYINTVIAVVIVSLAVYAYFVTEQNKQIKHEYNSYKETVKKNSEKAVEIAKSQQKDLNNQLTNLEVKLNDALSDNDAASVKYSSLLKQLTAEYSNRYTDRLARATERATDQSSCRLSAAAIEENTEDAEADAKRADIYAIRLNDLIDRYNAARQSLLSLKQSLSSVSQ